MLECLLQIDYTDSTPPVQVDDIREYENCEVCPVITPFLSVYIDKPKYVDNTGALRTGYIATTSPSIYDPLRTQICG